MTDVVKKTLSNGVTCYLYSDKNLKRFAVAYGVNYGNLGYFDRFYYEGREYHVPPAVAHFIEHTLIEKSKYGNLLFKFRDKNYSMNGGTGLETTTYYFIGIKDPYEGIKELINMVDDPVFTAEDVEDVKSAIAEEALKIGDSSYKTAQNLNMRALYKNFDAIHETGNVLGTKETTESITFEDVKVCYDAYYSDDNKILCIGGNFEIDEMVDFLEGVYGDIPRHPNKMKAYDYGDIFEIRTEREEISKPVSHDYVYASFKMHNDFDLGKMQLNDYIHMYLKQKLGSDTKFVEKLVNDKIVIGGIGYSVYFFKEDEFTVTISADVYDVDEFIRRVKDTLDLEDLDEKAFELYKRNLTVSQLSKMDYIYNSIISFPGNTEFAEKLYCIDEINACTFDEMKEVASRLDWSNEAITVIRKEDKNKK